MKLEFFRNRFPKYFLSGKESKYLMQRVAAFEKSTGCELVFHFRSRLGPDPLATNGRLFNKFGLHRTANRNALLITLALKERQFAIWADEGIMRQSGDKFWSEVCAVIGRNLKEGHRLKALLDAVEMIEPVLIKEQPATQDPGNEIANAPIVEDE